MKKNRFLWALLLLVSLGAAAQDNIHFVAGVSQSTKFIHNGVRTQT